MEKFVCLVLCLAVCISAGSALKCYTCDSDKVEDCLKSNKPKELICGNLVSGTAVCMYKHTHDTSKNTDHIKAGCEAQLSPGKDGVTECNNKLPGTEIKECRVCNSDLCNSSSMMSTSMASLLCLPLMYLVSKYVLS